MSDLGHRCTFIPGYLLQRLAGHEPEAVAETLEVDAHLRARRERSESAPPTTLPGAPGAPRQTPAAATGEWVVHTAGNTTDLPGTPARRPGEAETGDVGVDEAAASIVEALALSTQWGRSSYDGAGATVSITVHYGRNYDNAFWDGEQLVFGDGDGRVFDRFTKPMDVMGHEFAHGVTQYAAGLVYRDQPGALNESLSDVFASCMKQRTLGQSAAEADWLIGEGLFVAGVNARALRDMAAPGTAYDDPALGKDPQVGHMDDFIVTEDDNGGVHLNSGIPNRAFHRAAVAIGGNSWEQAGPIWWRAWTGGSLRPDSDFADFAALTVVEAGEYRDQVVAAWAEVGLEVGASTGPAPDSPAPTDPPTDSPGGPSTPPSPTTQGDEVVAVRRTGGFAGRTEEGAIDLREDTPAAQQAAMLCRRVEVAPIQGGPPLPDHFVYCFALPEREEFTVPEQHLTPDLSELAALVLAQGRPER